MITGKQQDRARAEVEGSESRHDASNFFMAVAWCGRCDPASIAGREGQLEAVHGVPLSADIKPVVGLADAVGASWLSLYEHGHT
jgi:hypothetical protein